MKTVRMFLISVIALGASALAMALPFETQSLSTNQDAQPSPATMGVVAMDRTPTFRVTVISRTARAVDYRHRSGATKVDFTGTELMPKANGQAKVESKQGY